MALAVRAGSLVEAFALRKSVERDTQNRVWAQYQNLSLRIVVAGDLTGHYPFAVDELALLHVAEADIPRAGGVGGEVDVHAASGKVIFVGAGGNQDCGRFQRRLGSGFCRSERRGWNHLSFRLRRNVRTAPGVMEGQRVIAQYDLLGRVSLVEPHGGDGVGSLVSQDHRG